jgi:RHS repeat-associated protein
MCRTSIRGKELDASTDLYNYGARYYDPLLARFLSADTLVPNPRDPQELNRYTYAGSNPFLYTDPTGHFKIKFTKFFQRALGDVGTAVVGVLGQSFGGDAGVDQPAAGSRSLRARGLLC